MPDPNAARAAAPTWSPQQYMRFGDHRLRPALELLDRVPIESPQIVFDLGCGTGNVTRIIAERWPAARVTGLDSSAAMLEQARRESDAVTWVEGAIEDWSPDVAPDLIFSNATLHWLNDHRTLLPRLAGTLRDGGVLAIQMPLSWELDSHRLIRETLADGAARGAPFGDDAWRRSVGRRWVAPAIEYHRMLAPRARMLDIWETEYLQELEGDDAVLEWVRGTGLRPVLEGLDDDARPRFLEVYRARLREAYPVDSSGRTLYPFRRLFIVARV